LEELVDLDLLLAHLVEVLRSDVAATNSESLDQAGVVEGEDNICDLGSTV